MQNPAFSQYVPLARHGVAYVEIFVSVLRSGSFYLDYGEIPTIEKLSRIYRLIRCRIVRPGTSNRRTTRVRMYAGGSTFVIIYNL